jgi:hypothetical protein
MGKRSRRRVADVPGRVSAVWQTAAAGPSARLKVADASLRSPMSSIGWVGLHP